uniref:Ribosomal protein L16 n=1 Tax=Asparagopsis taxiformis TaxID=260499 RepID=A0A0E3DBQ4_9FLOR|nr:ribosomal protein L16 [Asparagopsis taxiformis]AHX02397.1 ribosomal protein L16 [Asparagopsis taxiformis]
MKNIKKSYIRYSLSLNQSRHIIRLGCFGIKSLSFGILNKNQLISIERSLIQKIKSFNIKSFKVWNLLLLNLNLTKLSSESRMGKGKGSVYTQAAYIKPGMILFEFQGLTRQQMCEVFKFIKKKVSFNIILIKR